MSLLRRLEREHLDVPWAEQRAANLLGALALAVHDGRERSLNSGPQPVSLTAGAALAIVRELPGIQLVELRLALGVTHSACVRMLDQLQRTGLVVRSRDPYDARATLLRVTPEGDRRAKAFATARSSFTEALVRQIPPYWLPRLTRVFERLLAALTPDVRTALRVCRYCEPAICRVDPGAPCPVVQTAITRQATLEAEEERARQIPWWHETLPPEKRPPLPPLEIRLPAYPSPTAAVRWMIGLAHSEETPLKRQGRRRCRR